MSSVAVFFSCFFVASNYWAPLIGIGLIFGWWPIIRDAARALRRKQFELKFIISLTIMAALLAGRELMALALILLVLAGDELVNAVLRKVDKRLESFIGLTPQKAEIKVNEKITEVAIENIKKDDVVVIKPGKLVPVDGLLVDDNTWVSEAFLTGESKPIKK